MSFPIPTRKVPTAPKPHTTLAVQGSLLADDTQVSQYTSKIKAPIYEPKNKKPDIFSMVDTSKSQKLIAKIESSGLPKPEQHFLIRAAARHNVFNYKLIADYYAHATPEMQRLMEESALVIIDFADAVQNGYVKYSEEIADIYVKEHGPTLE